MRKYIMLFGVETGMLLLLTSCEVHFGNIHYDLHWWVIAIPVILFCVLRHCFAVSHTYACTECGTKFRPRWYEISTWINGYGGKAVVAKCPHCHRKQRCTKVDD